jgi:uncharacterized protein YbjQ (UPF0145 family)
MIINTTCVFNKPIKEYKGVVFGTSGRTRGIYGHLKASVEQIVGGRATSYVEAMQKARNAAIDDITANAEMMGANAIIGCDFEVIDVMDGYILVNVYGTAIVIEA